MSEVSLGKGNVNNKGIERGSDSSSHEPCVILLLFIPPPMFDTTKGQDTE